MALDEDARRRAARVLLAWSGKTQPELADDSGLKAARIKAWADKRNTAPTTDELFIMAAAVGVPEQFVVDGWAPPLHERVDVLEMLTAKLEETVTGLSADTAQLAQAIQELRAERPPGEPGGGTS